MLVRVTSPTMSYQAGGHGGISGVGVRGEGGVSGGGGEGRGVLN